MKAAVARDVDVVLIDTAGRLHTRAPLMDELREGAPRDRARGSRRAARDAARARRHDGAERPQPGPDLPRRVAVTGVVLTKLDGTARGGVADRHPARARPADPVRRRRRGGRRTCGRSTPASSCAALFAPETSSSEPASGEPSQGVERCEPGRAIDYSPPHLAGLAESSPASGATRRNREEHDLTIPAARRAVATVRGSRVANATTRNGRGAVATELHACAPGTVRRVP